MVRLFVVTVLVVQLNQSAWGQQQVKGNFDPLQNGLVFNPTVFQYDLASDEKKLKVFDYTIDSLSLNWKFLKNKEELSLFWPQDLIPFGQLEVIASSGAVVWSHKLEKSILDEWREENPKSKASFIIEDFDGEVFGKIKKLTRFKVCLTNKLKGSFARLCTGSVKLNKKSELERFAKTDEVKLYIQNEKAALRGEYKINQGEELKFFAQTKEGASFEFLTRPHNLNLVDFTKNADGKLNIVGHTNFPLNDFVKVKTVDKSFLAKIGWLPTIGDNREYWKATREPTDVSFMISSDAGGVFKQTFQATRAPAEKDRLTLDPRVPKATYVDKPRLYGTAPKGYTVKSTETSATMLDKKTGEFEWYARATKKDTETFSTLLTEKEGETWAHTFGIYRSRPAEISARLTGISTGGQTIFLGEIAYNHWFETLFGMRSYYLSQQRWGYSLKLFQSLGGIKQKDSDEVLKISAMTFDLKYRLSPGTWGRDETWGLLLGYESVQVNTVVVPMLGAGFFWARSMPKIFDDLFNIIPIMRYPKWVDLEYIHYFSGLKSEGEYGSNYAMNFHGKVLWTPTIFGEAGFGAKSTNMLDTNLNQKTEFTSFYGTVGLGINF